MNTEDNKQRINLHLELGRAYANAEQYPEALEELQYALEAAPDFADIHYELGVVLVCTGAYDRAVEQFNAALEINPNYLEARQSLANVLYEMGRQEEAAHHRRLLQYVQSHKGQLFGMYGGKLANAHASVGDLYAEIGMFQEAALEYEKAVQIAPQFFDIVLRLARAYMTLDELEKAESTVERVISRDSRFRFQATRMLGSILQLKGEPDKAIKVWKMLLEKRPDDPETMAMLRQAEQMKESESK
jgi:tetratricopeptide (TPR) repeat protein